ncbi:MAG: PEP-CTERM sorting domain-containing protein [Verrucomicrobiota bacterium JB024]|nr:PEP-CTERM sorting domain-containing protein [Verrucomicrobiota bacterium JB024]
MLKKITVLLLASSFALTAAQASLSLTVQGFTANSITFKLEGDLSGSTPNSFIHQLYIQPEPNTWILSGGGMTASDSPLSDVALDASDQGILNGGTLPYLCLNFERTLTTSPTPDSGTGTFVTFTSESTVFDTSYTGDLTLGWGYNGESSTPFGTIQSSTAVPEPSTYAGLGGILILGVILATRRFKRSTIR